MRAFEWRRLALALMSYIVIASSGYYLLVEPRTSRLIAVEIAFSSLLGIGPRPISVDQLSNAAIWFDIAALTIGFLLRLLAIALVAVMFVRRDPETYRGKSRQEWNARELSLKARRN